MSEREPPPGMTMRQHDVIEEIRLDTEDFWTQAESDKAIETVKTYVRSRETATVGQDIYGDDGQPIEIPGTGNDAQG